MGIQDRKRRIRAALPRPRWNPLRTSSDHKLYALKDGKKLWSFPPADGLTAHRPWEATALSILEAMIRNCMP